MLDSAERQWMKSWVIWDAFKLLWINMTLAGRHLPSSFLTGVAVLGLSHLLWVKFCIWNYLQYEKKKSPTWNPQISNMYHSFQNTKLFILHSILCDIKQINIKPDNSIGILQCEMIPYLNDNSYIKVALLHYFILHWCV